MSSLVRSVTADANGSGTVTFNQIPTGIQWIVSQTTVETIPQGVGCSAYIKRNGRLLSSTPFGSSSSAGGDPAITISPGDDFSIEWQGAPAGSALVGTIFYQEVPYGELPTHRIV
jgi:hypothetical protein